MYLLVLWCYNHSFESTLNVSTFEGFVKTKVLLNILFVVIYGRLGANDACMVQVHTRYPDEGFELPQTYIAEWRNW